MITFEILFCSGEEVALSVQGRSMRLSHPRFACAKGMYFGRFARRSFDGGSTSCEHVSTTYGAKLVQGFWRSQERKDISRGSGCAWISKPKLHDTHVSLISDLFKEHSHLYESSNASSAVFRLCTHAVGVSQQHAIR